VGGKSNSHHHSSNRQEGGRCRNSDYEDRVGNGECIYLEDPMVDSHSFHHTLKYTLYFSQIFTLYTQIKSL